MHQKRATEIKEGLADLREALAHPGRFLCSMLSSECSAKLSSLNPERFEGGGGVLNWSILYVCIQCYFGGQWINKKNIKYPHERFCLF